jgi:hypothetical protein
MVAKRVVRDFEMSENPWPAVEQWAGQQGFKVREQSESQRLYQKGKGFFTGSRRVDIKVHDGQVHLEGWVHANMPARMMSLFILPANITLESGGFKGTLPRKLGRGELNPLLEALGQPAIE